MLSDELTISDKITEINLTKMSYNNIGNWNVVSFLI